MPYEQVPIVQKQLLRRALDRGIPTIRRHPHARVDDERAAPHPRRSQRCRECGLRRGDIIMLSGETAIGATRSSRPRPPRASRHCARPTVRPTCRPGCRGLPTPTQERSPTRPWPSRHTARLSRRSAVTPGPGGRRGSCPRCAHGYRSSRSRPTRTSSIACPSSTEWSRDCVTPWTRLRIGSRGWNGSWTTLASFAEARPWSSSLRRPRRFRADPVRHPSRARDAVGSAPRDMSGVTGIEA